MSGTPQLNDVVRGDEKTEYTKVDKVKTGEIGVESNLNG